MNYISAHLLCFHRCACDLQTVLRVTFRSRGRADHHALPERHRLLLEHPDGRGRRRLLQGFRGTRPPVHPARARPQGHQAAVRAAGRRAGAAARPAAAAAVRVQPSLPRRVARAARARRRELPQRDEREERRLHALQLVQMSGGAGGVSRVGAGRGTAECRLTSRGRVGGVGTTFGGEIE